MPRIKGQVVTASLNWWNKHW